MCYFSGQRPFRLCSSMAYAGEKKTKMDLPIAYKWPVPATRHKLDSGTGREATVSHLFVFGHHRSTESNRVWALTMPPATYLIDFKVTKYTTSSSQKLTKYPSNEAEEWRNRATDIGAICCQTSSDGIYAWTSSVAHCSKKVMLQVYYKTQRAPRCTHLFHQLTLQCCWSQQLSKWSGWLVVFEGVLVDKWNHLLSDYGLVGLIGVVESKNSRAFVACHGSTHPTLLRSPLLKFFIEINWTIYKGLPVSVSCHLNCAV